MKIKKGTFPLLLILLVLSKTAVGQCRQAKWPENRQLAEEKIALYGDALKQGHYLAAREPLQWMIKNAPGWHLKMYIDGAKMYNKLAKKEKDKAKQAKLVDTLLWIYDERIRECGGRVKVLNRKVYAAYKYEISNKDKVEELLAMYDSLFAIAEGKVSGGNLVAYMTTLKANRIFLNKPDDEAVLERYDVVMEIVNKNIKAAQAANDQKKTEKYKKYKDVVDGLLVSVVKVDCKFVKANLASRFERNPNDLALAKKIFGFMLKGKCTDDPLWLKTGEAILKVEKDLGLMKNIALKYYQEKSFDKAGKLLKEALKHAKKGEDKADITIYLGSIAAEKGNKILARQYFRQASALNSTEKRGYEKVGDLYYGSFNQCSEKESMAQDRLVYIAAYNMYKHAGSTKKMTLSKSQFPSKEEIFLLNWHIGEEKNVGCWIGETVKVATRN